MDKRIVFYISLLLGTFLTISVFLIYKIVPQTVSKKTLETFQNSENSVKIDEVLPEKSQLSTLPYKESIVMFLSTFNNAESVSYDDMKWYDTFLVKSSYSSVETNTKHYFNMNNMTVKDDGEVHGVSINNVSLKGPNSFYFSQDNSGYLISDFTTIMMLKIKDISSTPIVLYELPCNTTTESEGEDIHQIANNISISLFKKIDNRVKIKITFGSLEYDVADDISTDLLITETPTLFAMSFKNKKISFIINTEVYNVDIINDVSKLSLGSLPIVINKSGALDGILYSYAHYSRYLDEKEIFQFQSYIMNQINGNEKNEGLPKSEVGASNDENT